MTLPIEHDQNSHQFVTDIEDQRAILNYRIGTGEKTLEYYHTFVPPELRGRHIGQDLVKFALDYAIQNGYKVIPTCPFVRAYMERHPEYNRVLG